MVKRLCPCCQEPLCLREGSLDRKAGVRWYKPVLPVQFCASCGTQLQPRFRHTVWIALALWLTIGSLGIFVTAKFESLNFLPGETVQHLRYGLVLIMYLLAAALVRYFMEYKIVREP